MLQEVWAGHLPGQVECRECGRSFSRQGNLKRHKCVDEQNKPIKEQRGSLQCPTCERWFKSAEGLSVHRKKLHDRFIGRNSMETNNS